MFMFAAAAPDSSGPDRSLRDANWRPTERVPLGAGSNRIGRKGEAQAQLSQSVARIVSPLSLAGFGTLALIGIFTKACADLVPKPGILEEDTAHDGAAVAGSSRGSVSRRTDRRPR